MCFEGNVAEKQILPEQRKEKAGTDDSPRSGLPPTQHLLRRAVVLLTGPIALWVIARGSQEEGSQKIRVRGRGTVKEEQLSQEGGCRLVSPAEPHRGFRCMLICCSLFTWVSKWEHSCVCVCVLVVVVGLVLVCCSCNLARPFKIIILALYHSSLTQEPFLFAFCSESNRISRTWDQKIHLHS